MNTQGNEGRLLRIHQALSHQQQRNLLDYADFLFQRSGGSLSEGELLLPDGVLAVPEFEDSPDSETVTGALTRLSRVYHMLDIEALQAQASLAILDGSAMRDKTARQLIDELERFFAERYQRARLVC